MTGSNDDKNLLSSMKETVGAASRRLLLNKDTNQGIVDTEKEINKDYFDQCQQCVEREPHKDWKDPWFLVVISKKERLMENVIRRYFFGRKTLPTPEYDQTVWRYHPSSGNLEFVWCVPDKNTTLWLGHDPNAVDTSHNHLVSDVLDFLNNRLYDKFVKKFS